MAIMLLSEYCKRTCNYWGLYPLDMRELSCKRMCIFPAILPTRFHRILLASSIEAWSAVAAGYISNRSVPILSKKFGCLRFGIELIAFVGWRRRHSIIPFHPRRILQQNKHLQTKGGNSSDSYSGPVSILWRARNWIVNGRLRFLDYNLNPPSSREQLFPESCPHRSSTMRNDYRSDGWQLSVSAWLTFTDSGSFGLRAPTCINSFKCREKI